jgi:hypothetical protein
MDTLAIGIGVRYTIGAAGDIRILLYMMLNKPENGPWRPQSTVSTTGSED